MLILFLYVQTEYMDPGTLWERLNDAINTIIRRDESTETGDLLPPCIEGTHFFLYWMILIQCPNNAMSVLLIFEVHELKLSVIYIPSSFQGIE